MALDCRRSNGSSCPGRPKRYLQRSVHTVCPRTDTHPCRSVHDAAESDCAHQGPSHSMAGTVDSPYSGHRVMPSGVPVSWNVYRWCSFVRSLTAPLLLSDCLPGLRAAGSRKGRFPFASLYMNLQVLVQDLCGF